jgi:gas vesicle protein
MENRTPDDRQFWSFAFGALAGALVGLLVAPLSGRETRERVSRRVRRTAASARAVGDRLRKGAAAAKRAVTTVEPAGRIVEPEPAEPLPADRLP